MKAIFRTLFGKPKHIIFSECKVTNNFFFCQYVVRKCRTKVTFQNNFRFAITDDHMRNKKAIGSTNLTSSEFNHDSERHRVKHNRLKKLKNFICEGEILFGIHPVYLALKQQKRKFFQLFLKIDSQAKFGKKSRGGKIEVIENLANSYGIGVRRLCVRDMNCLTSHSVHQGVCLDASKLIPHALEYREAVNKYENLSPPYPLWLVLNEVQDPMNVGAIFRSGYFFGVEKIFLCKSSCKLSPVVSKASSGAMEVMDIFEIDDLQNFLQQRKNSGFSLVSTACDTNSSEENIHSNSVIELHNFNPEKPTVLLIGNEGTGLQPMIQSMCDVIVSIRPKQTLSPGIDSLNVSVATGIMLHHITNSWRATK